ncbi:MAG: hypothetical protein AAFU85_03075 [Planctomycetota bacterium]
MPTIRETCSVIALTGIAFATGVATAQAPIATPTPVLTDPTDDAGKERREVAAEKDDSLIAGLVDEMGSPRLAARRDAAKRLREMGLRAHPSLAKVAIEGDPERTMIAMRLLADALQSEEEAVVESARKALEKIGENANPQGIAANRLLREQIRPEPRLVPPNNNMGLNQRLIPRAFNPGQQLIPAPGFNQGQVNLRVSVRTINGVRSIEVVQNNRTFRFNDVAGGLEVERPDDKGGSTKKLYKDSAELKSKDREAYDVYQKAGGDGQANPVRAMPPMFGPNPGIPNFPRFPRMQLLPPVELPPIPAPKLKKSNKPKPVEV